MTKMFVLTITLKSGIQERLCDEDRTVFDNAMKAWELLMEGNKPWIMGTPGCIFSYSNNFKVLLSEVVMMAIHQTEVEE